MVRNKERLLPAFSNKKLEVSGGKVERSWGRRATVGDERGERKTNSRPGGCKRVPGERVSRPAGHSPTAASTVYEAFLFDSIFKNFC